MLWSLFLFVLFGCQARSGEQPHQAPEGEPYANWTEIRLSHREGGMWMREYDLSLSRGGEVNFRGKYGARELGESETWRVPSEDVDQLLKEFSAAGFLRLAPKAAQSTAIDQATRTITLVGSGESKSVTRMLRGHEGMSDDERKMEELERAIITAAGAEARIRECCYPGYPGPLP